MIGLQPLLVAVSVLAGGDDRTQPADAGLEETVEVLAQAPAPEDVAAFATVIDADDLVLRGEDLAQVLRRVPGARVREIGGLGRTATVSLRSSTAEQVVVTVDGVPQNRALGGPVDLSFVPATQIARVTVFRGFAPAAAGVASLGGLVDIRTRPPADEVEGRVDLLAGELETRRGSAGVSAPLGDGGALRFGAEWLASDGDFEYLDTRATPFDPGDDVRRTRRNNDVENTSLLAQATWRGDGDGRLRVAARFQDRDQGVPGVDSRPTPSARLERRLADATASWSRRRSGALGAVDLTLQGFDDETRYTDRETALQDQTTDLEGFSGSALVRFGSARHHALARVEARREEARVRDDALEVSDRGGADRRLLSIVVEDLITFRHFAVAPSLGWIHRDDRFVAGGGGTLPPPATDVDEGNLYGKIGWTADPPGDCVVRGSLGHFFRNPDLLELFGDRGAVRGNPDLRPEKGDSAEAGVSCDRSGGRARWRTEVVAFARRVEDLIRFLPNSQGVSVARNLQRVEILGLEASLSWTGRRGFSIDASGTLQDPVYASGGAADGERLVYSPSKLGFLSGSWQGRRLGARWEITYVGDNGTDTLDTPALRLPSRVIHDTGLSWNVRPGLRVGVDVRNVFDRETRDVARFPLPGRTAYVTLGWSWGGATS